MSGRNPAAVSRPDGPSNATRVSWPRRDSASARSVGVVVDDQHLPRLHRLDLERRDRPRLHGGVRDGREPDLELAALADALAAHVDRAVVEHDEAADDRQAEAEPTLGAVDRARALDEPIEQIGEQVGRDPHAVVAHDHDDLVIDAFAEQRDPALAVGVLGRVGEEIRDHLTQARLVAVDEQVGLELDLEQVPALLEDRATGLDRLRDDVGELDRPAVELDLALRDARDVEQIVDQHDDVADLALDHGALADRALFAARLHHLDRR